MVQSEGVVPGGPGACLKRGDRTNPTKRRGLVEPESHAPICSGTSVVHVIEWGRCGWERGGVSSDSGFFEETCACFDLGTIVARPEVIPGGLSNRLYRVVTGRGQYAVKRMVANANSASFKHNVEASFAVEQLAQAAGIAMPAPIPAAGTNEALARIADGEEHCWVRVHSWVGAERITEVEIDPGDIAAVGAILATLHGLPTLDAGSTSAQDPHSMERDWRTALHASAYAPRAVPSLLGAIDGLEGLVGRGYAVPRSTPVLSHRDLDAKNLLRGDRGELIVIDWDAAGPVDPQWDAVGVAMDWSGVRQGPVSQPAFDGFLDAYALAGGHLDPITPEHFAGWAEGVLDWLWFNLERAGSPDPSERLRGRREVGATARFLPAAAAWIMDRSFQR